MVFLAAIGGGYDGGNKKRVTAFSAVTLIYTGGVDETRTRDLRRDRPAF